MFVVSRRPSVHSGPQRHHQEGDRRRPRIRIPSTPSTDLDQRTGQGPKEEKETVKEIPRMSGGGGTERTLAKSGNVLSLDETSEEKHLVKVSFHQEK